MITEPTGTSRRIWKGNIKMGLKKVGFEGVNWMQLAQGKDHHRATVDIGNEPSTSKNGKKFVDQIIKYQFFKENYPIWSLSPVCLLYALHW
jgi:hypothetical protein